MSENNSVKMVLTDGTVIEGTVEELAKMAHILGGIETPFNVGDYVEVTSKSDAMLGIGEGDIVRIVNEDADGSYKYCITKEGALGYANAENLCKLFLSDRELSFIRAGRNIDEIKEGDIVEVTGEVDTGSMNRPGDIGVAGEGSWGAIIQVPARNWGGGNHHLFKDLKLIAPASARVDIDD